MSAARHPRASSRPPAPSPTGSPPPCWSPPAPPGSTPSASRPRPGPARPTSSWRPTACSPRPSSPSSPAGTCSVYGTKRRVAGDGRRHHPQQRPRQPRGRLLRAGPVHARGHPGQPDGRRSLPPARLRHDVRGRLRAGPDPGRPCHRTGPCARLHARRGHRPLRTVVPASPELRSRRPTRPRPGRRVGRAGRRRTAPSPCAGSDPADVDVCEFYDPFSFEIIRQFEALRLLRAREKAGTSSWAAPSTPAAATR